MGEIGFFDKFQKNMQMNSSFPHLLFQMHKICGIFYQLLYVAI